MQGVESKERPKIPMGAIVNTYTTVFYNRILRITFKSEYDI
jgi:hypothetical protein